MPNISIGQRLNRGDIVTTRTSIALPEDTLDLIKAISVFKVSTPSSIIVQAVERGLRQLAAEDFPKSGHLSKQEIRTILENLK